MKKQKYVLGLIDQIGWDNKKGKVIYMNQGHVMIDRLSAKFADKALQGRYIWVAAPAGMDAPMFSTSKYPADGVQGSFATAQEALDHFKSKCTYSLLPVAAEKRGRIATRKTMVK